RANLPGAWHFAWWCGLFSVFAFGLLSCFRHCRGFERRRGIALASGLMFFLVCLVLQFAISYHLIAFTNFAEYGLLALILQMSFAMTKELRESERRLKLVLDNVPVAVYLKDIAGRYLLVNRQCEMYTGISAAMMIGKTDSDLFPAGQADQ